jgi:hypothetical protein
MSGAWVAQTVGALGAAKAEGIRNQLGRPTLDRLTVLIRESAQNSWDARDPACEDPVHFSVELVRLGAQRAEIWRELFRESSAMPGVRVAAALSEPDPWLLTISDRGTVGLAGPTRGDEPQDDLPKNYTSFVLNSGDTGEGVGGGTYGFGKSSFFSASRTASVLVHTRCEVGDRHESRLVGIALGHSHTFEGVNYTGRHWWGYEVNGGVEPLRDVEADAWAKELSLPGFEAGTLGTTIALACPNLGDRSPETAGEWMREAILWHLWPKMLTGADGAPAMTFNVVVDGAELPVPSPDEHPVIRVFADAFRRADSGGEGAETLEAASIGKRAGRLALRKSLAPRPDLSEVARECGLGTAIHHVCLLRTPNLVVQYLAGDEPADPSVWYAGVFKTFDEVNRVYARSEPPTHDEWVASQLEGEEKTLVNSTTRQIKRKMRDFVRPAFGGDPDSPFVALGAASRYFADLLGDVSGEGAGVTPSTGRAGSRKQVRLVGDARWERIDGADVLVQDVDVQPTRAVAAEASLAIAAWGGGAVADAALDDDDQAGTVGDTDPEPVLLGWRGPDGRLEGGIARIFDVDDSGVWQLIIRPVEDTVTSIALRSGDVA